MMRRNKYENQQLLIFILLFITVAALCVTVWALFFRTPDVMLIPDYAPVDTEAHARPIPGDTQSQSSAQPGSGAVSLTYSTQVEISLGSRSVALLFANPGKSNQDMVLQIVIQDTVLLQSGRLTPGNQVTELELTKDSAAMLRPGGYEGSFRVFYYDTETGDKAIVNTEIPISITVTG